MRQLRETSEIRLDYGAISQGSGDRGSDVRVVLPTKLPFLSRNSRLVTVCIYHIRYC